ncbi:hypothetical protein [Bacteroides pyogenes]|uniref:hypothetical protein n=1 Tax=Bacteroides pyogenes TaxID=310300 RepID=UPI0003DCACBA|nr:hypothetical protein [Bacteroides pyogenes]MBB3895556.1 hypothetical protein [Bacteroides pyogenes]GAE22007.1 hypothetical protein JCM10003_1541 [Bacteroides pyogenes JCM 10003]SUV34555.1 putative lipoprotein [Bacteroides pyogenes]
MKNIKKFSLLTAFTVLTLVGISCGNKQKSGAAESVLTEQTGNAALDVDSLLANAGNLAGQEVTVEGVCTHTCKHGAKKIFLMGSDDTQTIRVEAGALGAFDAKCVNSIVRVKGYLKEQRIDEAYLQEWEAQINAQSEKKHGEGEEGCSTEKKARGETAATSADRIADFRAKIAANKEKSGKDYLSFYYIEATSYDIQE